MNQIPLKDIISSSLENLKQVIDVDNVIGKPIPLDGGGVVIPVSKVALGFTSGGVDYDGKKTDVTHFGGASGAGMTIQPIAFLVVRGDDVRLVNINQPTADGIVGTVNELIDRAPAMIEKLKAMFKKDKKEVEEVEG
ncbi:MAG: sporulation protein YtfJ [Clostridia bacterium]|nr:sporulation protein YtfJ [Clostridia bacterium]